MVLYRSAARLSMRVCLVCVQGRHLSYTKKVVISTCQAGWELVYRFQIRKFAGDRGRQSKYAMTPVRCTGLAVYLRTCVFQGGIMWRYTVVLPERAPFMGERGRATLDYWGQEALHSSQFTCCNCSTKGSSKGFWLRFLDSSSASLEMHIKYPKGATKSPSMNLW